MNRRFASGTGFDLSSTSVVALTTFNLELSLRVHLRDFAIFIRSGARSPPSFFLISLRELLTVARRTPSSLEISNEVCPRPVGSEFRVQSLKDLAKATAWHVRRGESPLALVRCRSGTILHRFRLQIRGLRVLLIQIARPENDDVSLNVFSQHVTDGS